MGILELDTGSLGFEASGIVRRVGSQVKHINIGDRVMLMDRGTLSTMVTTSESRCAKIPDSLDFQQAATMPCVYATAMYSLFNVGGLLEGQASLIHILSTLGHC
jgi:NADPH:quinone reductase-like Zn-dependent oxidoreductase